VKRLDRSALPADLEVLADRNKRRHSGILRTERSRNHRSDVRHCHRLRRNVAGVPVILVARVENVSEIGRLESSDDRAAIHDACDTLETLRDLDVIGGRVDGRKRAQHALGSHAGLERRIALRIPRLGLRHPAGHP
jgi:hypothetical protein